MSKLSDNHWRVEGYKQTVKRKDLQEILLDEPTPIRCGRCCDIKSKHIGAGVYEIWLEEKKYD